jgi:hypothetical protein
MKTKTFLTFSLILISILGYSQNLSTEVRKDFCKNAILNAYFGSGSLKSWIIISAQKVGYKTPFEIENAVQNLCSDIKLQNEILENIDKLGGSKEFKEQQFLSIGMTPKNAKFLSDYLLLKRINNQKNTPKVEEIDNNFVKDSTVIDKKKLLRNIPKSKFTNDSTAIFRRVGAINEYGSPTEIEYKTSVLKEYYYIGENNENHDDEERVNVVLLSEYNGKNAFLETLTFKILNNGNDYQNIRNRRLNISSKKLNNCVFNTIKENGQTYFTVEYLDDDNSKKIDYYSPLDLKYLKTIVKEEVVQKETINKVIPKNNTNLSTETKENEAALIKDIFRKNGKIYISLNIVQIEYTKENDYKVINQNSKIRTFEVLENVKITDNNCRTIDENDYLIKNREIHISKNNDEICMFSPVDGIITEINFGCWN